MKITAIMMGSQGSLLHRAAEKCGVDLKFYQIRYLEQNPEKLEEVKASMRESDVILLSRSTEMFWDVIEDDIKNIAITIPLICLSHDPSYWILSSVKPEVVSTCQQYVTYNGEENIENLVTYIQNLVLNVPKTVPPPEKTPWDGIYHPDSEKTFYSTEEYLKWYSPRVHEGSWVGILFSRTAWASGSNTAIEDAIIRSLELEGMNVITVFSYPVKDTGLGTRGMAGVIEEFLVLNGQCRVDAIIKLMPTLLGGSSEEKENSYTFEATSRFLQTLNVPIFSPIISYYQSIEQWKEGNGLTADTSFFVAMPEFEGVIEPIIIGTSNNNPEIGRDDREAIPDRCRKVAQRVKQWTRLSKKPISERKVAFILNNNPCASAEASIGGGAHLDTLESVARILKRMKEAGYQVDYPESGEELIKTMLEKKAMSEFRWTTVQDIAANGGVLMSMDIDTFSTYFSTLSKTVQEKITSTWGEAPGLSMVLDGKILITGLSFGNSTVHVQPKRGCYGSRCDGEVCKILHDPECPPPHQYLATYYWIEKILDADVIVHVGTHGNQEWLPGKGLGLSEDCFPDVAIGTTPYLYIYNADNPPEGTIAKRRGYATLVDHLQTVMIQGGLYEGLEELDVLLGQYETAKLDPARSHALQHLIRDAIAEVNLDKDIHLTDEMSLDDIVSHCHEALSLIRNTQIPSGMHTFGELPEGEKRLNFINAIIRYDSGDPSPRRTIARLHGHDLTELVQNQNGYSQELGLSYGAILEQLEEKTKDFIRAVIDQSLNSYADWFNHAISDEDIVDLDKIRDRIYDINNRINDSKEIESLFNGYSGGHIPAGPSGLISRGHEEVLPTGRNFYSLDPFMVPTKAAWRVGQRLSESLLSKYLQEEGKYPENIAFYWMASDIMSADGEMYAQLMALLGVEPVWQSNGRVKSFTIIPLEKLGRPRIDITVRGSGLIRDNFSNCYELLDDAVQAVAALDEPLEQNYIKKHTQESMEQNQSSWKDATLRIFSTKPGTYYNGVDLAVYASAWKTEADLAEIFVAWNGYALRKDREGEAVHEQFATNLSKVSVTFNKVQSDEYDLLGCCCYFGTHGGMTAAARHYSGNEVKPYYGDTREPEQIEVRDLADELRRVVRTKLLNPKWIDGMKEHGYKGAGDIMRRVTHVYGWEASTQEVDDWIFDDIAETFVNDEEMRQFFEENNPYALEEIARRLLEAEQRGLWEADQQVLEELKNNYLQIESWMEDKIGEGDYQGGSVDIYTQDDIAAWGESMKDIMAKVQEKFPIRKSNS